MIEAPAIYAALDSLGQRVAAWTERQHRAGQPLGADPAEGVLSPEEAAACAERAIKQVRAAFLGVLCTWCPVGLLCSACGCRSTGGVLYLAACCSSVWRRGDHARDAP